MFLKFLIALTLLVSSAQATTYYVRTDGGTRYSTNQIFGKCNGKADAPYPGSGVNQPCAFNDVRFLWQDGSYSYGTNFPSWGWIGQGGDTYIVRGSIAEGVSYRVGWDSPTSHCGSTLCFGVTGNPYGSGAPPIPSGTAAQHTTFAGGNFGSCHTQSARTQIHGGYGVASVLQMVGSSYVDVSCLDITDFSSCGRAGQVRGCNNAIGSLDDYATNGITWSNTSNHDTLTDVRVHGMAASGMSGPTGDGVTFNYLDLIGNPSSGWNADAGNGYTGTGTLMVSNYNFSWNGCAEEYPIVDALPYRDCTDDNSGGYGDGFGTATVASSPGWKATFDTGIVSYNTQDGLDALHLTGAGSSMTITNTTAYGNMGQQIKNGGAAGTVTNSVIYTNCNALRQAIPGTPSGYNSRLSDFCRAADTGILLTVSDGSTLTYKGNTIYSASRTAIEIAIEKACTGPTCLIDFEGNTFVGFINGPASGYVNGGTSDYSNPIYLDSAMPVFTNSASKFSGNTTFHAKSQWSCPALSLKETNATCGDPKLSDETWHLYGIPTVAITPNTVTSATPVGTLSIPSSWACSTTPQSVSFPTTLSGKPASLLVVYCFQQ